MNEEEIEYIIWILFISNDQIGFCFLLICFLILLKSNLYAFSRLKFLVPVLIKRGFKSQLFTNRQTIYLIKSTCRNSERKPHHYPPWRILHIKKITYTAIILNIEIMKNF